MSFFLRQLYLKGSDKEALKNTTELNHLKEWLIIYCNKNKTNLLTYTTIQRYCPYSIRKFGKAKLEPLIEQLILLGVIQSRKINKTRYILLLK